MAGFDFDHGRHVRARTDRTQRRHHLVRARVALFVAARRIGHGHRSEEPLCVLVTGTLENVAAPVVTPVEEPAKAEPEQEEIFEEAKDSNDDVAVEDLTDDKK